MKFMNPLPVECESCGVQQSHDPSRLLAYQARCVGCSALLQESARRMHHGISRSNAIHAQLVLAMELEDAFGLSLNDNCLHEEHTLDAFLAAIVLQQPELAARARELRAYGVQFLSESVHPLKLDRVEQDPFYDLYASGSDRSEQKMRSR